MDYVEGRIFTDPKLPVKKWANLALFPLKKIISFGSCFRGFLLVKGGKFIRKWPKFWLLFTLWILNPLGFKKLEIKKITAKDK